MKKYIFWWLESLDYYKQLSFLAVKQISAHFIWSIIYFLFFRKWPHGSLLMKRHLEAWFIDDSSMIQAWFIDDSSMIHW